MAPEADQSRVRDAVRAALAEVIDPCSRFNGSHLDLVELGMIDRVEIDGDATVEITLLLDDPTCLYAASICQQVTAAVSAVRGVEAVTVAIRADELWTAARLSEAARSKLAHWREERVAMGDRVTGPQRLRLLT